LHRIPLGSHVERLDARPVIMPFKELRGLADEIVGILKGHEKRLVEA
jgi:hypothetical protein